MRITCLMTTISLAFATGAIAQNTIDTNSFHSCLLEFAPGNSLVCLGEAHEVAGTYELETFLIGELAPKGYRFVLIEGGVSESELLNQYMKTGNEEVLQFTRARGVNYRKLITSIRGINKEIRFIGIDFERGICLERLFKSWFANINQPEWQDMLDKLRKINSHTPPKTLKNTLVEAKAWFVKHEQSITTELGPDAGVLRRILFNPVFGADYHMFSSKKRDRAVLQNLLTIENEVLNKSILIFGSNHFTNEGHFWANFLPDREMIDVTLILFAYHNCTNYLKKGKYYSAKPLSKFFIDYEIAKPGISFKVITDKALFPVGDRNKLIIARLTGV